MPKIIGLTTEQKLQHQKSLLADRCDTLLYSKKITKKSVAEYLNISPQALNQQFRENRLTADAIMAIITIAKPDPETIVDWLTIGGRA